MVGTSATASLTPEMENLVIAFSMIEWDAADRRDPNADNRTAAKVFANTDGEFASAIGSHTLTAYGLDRSTCEVRLTYAVSVD